MHRNKPMAQETQIQTAAGAAVFWAPCADPIRRDKLTFGENVD